MEQAEKCILKRKERDECSIGIARENGHDDAGERIEEAVIRGRDDDEKDKGGI